MEGIQHKVKLTEVFFTVRGFSFFHSLTNFNLDIRIHRLKYVYIIIVMDV